MGEKQEDLCALLQQLRDGTLPPASLMQDATYHAIHELGRAQVKDAIPIIEQYLMHEDGEYRYVALEVLTNHFHLPRHWSSAVHTLRHDPNERVRMGAAAALAHLMGDTKDPATLRELAITLNDPNEDYHVRSAAWAAIQTVLHYNAREQLDLAMHNLNLERDVDWEFVRKYLPSDAEAK